MEKEKKTQPKIEVLALRETTLKTGEERKVSFSFMTEDPCPNWDVSEVCLCGEGNVDLTRYHNGVMPLLFNHNRDIVIGSVDNIEFADGAVRATCTLDKDDEAEKIYQKVKSGSLKGVSVGYRRLNVVKVREGESYEGKTYDEDVFVTYRWQPYEVSIVSCPADPKCSVGRELNDLEIEVETLERDLKEDSKMGEENKDTVQAQERAVSAIPAAVKEKAAEVDVNAIRAAETERVADIYGVCRKFNVEADTVDKYIRNGVSVDTVKGEILERMAKEQKAMKASVDKVEVGETAEVKRTRAMADGLAMRYGYAGKDSVDGAEKYSTCSIRRIAEDCMVDSGMKMSEVRDMSDMEVFSRLTAERAMGSEQFSSVIDNFGNKVMRKAYTEQPTIFKKFVSIGQNRDFKPTHKYMVGVDGEPTIMAHESAEFKYQEMTDSKVSTSIQTYGKAIAFTREIFINDDMGTVANVMAKQASGFRRLQDKMFFETLAKVPFFKKNKNIVETHKDISVEAYQEMRVLMRHQMDNEEKAFIGVFPAFILASDFAEMEHAKLLMSPAYPGGNNSGVVNPLQNKMELVTTPYIEGKEYYAIARPSEMDGIEYTTLRGIDTPTSRIVVPSNHLGLDLQMYMDFGFNIIDYRAFVKNPGEE